MDKFPGHISITERARGTTINIVQLRKARMALVTVTTYVVDDKEMTLVRSLIKLPLFKALAIIL